MKRADSKCVFPGTGVYSEEVVGTQNRPCCVGLNSEGPALEGRTQL